MNKALFNGFLVLLTSTSMILSGADQRVNPITTDLPPENLSTPSAGEEHYLMSLDQIIKITGESYNNLQTLRKEIVEYKKLQERYVKNPNDRVLLFQLAGKAGGVFEKIKENELTYAFDAEFLKELSLFSRIAKKTGPQRP
ncbi:MAG: hypothetical protein K940chlam7_00578 [Chlamydiae bacterium]|nr:hypothetical protein [Chlamydiota bacterium]